MTKSKQRPHQVTEAIERALARERAKRNANLKPIEIVKIAICAFQKHYQHIPGDETVAAPSAAALAANVESDDRAGLRKGTQASVDRLLFNVNYWRAAYEDRIVASCDTPDDARTCLRAIAAWNSHTMKLNTLSNDEAKAQFERFCPPFAANNRRGGQNRQGSGKGPVQDFAQLLDAVGLAISA